MIKHGRIPEWPKGADCKSVIDDFEGSNPSPPIKKERYKKDGVFQWTHRLFYILRLFCLKRCHGKVIVWFIKMWQEKDICQL